MRNKIAKIFKVTAIVIFCLGFIGGILYGIWTQNIAIFFTTCIMSFIQGIIFYAIAEIIEQLDHAATINRGIYNTLEKIEKKISESTVQKAIIKNGADENPESFTWNCPQCGNMNLSTSLFCKMCGMKKNL